MEICEILKEDPDHAIGVVDCDGGGIDNKRECDPDGNPNTNDGTNPKNPRDDDPNPEFNPCPATVYNRQLAQRRTEAGVAFFLVEYQRVTEHRLNESTRVRARSAGITNRDTYSKNNNHFDQAITFYFYHK